MSRTLKITVGQSFANLPKKIKKMALYIFLDDKLIGYTSEIGTVSFSIDQGTHQLHITNYKGASIFNTPLPNMLNLNSSSFMRPENSQVSNTVYIPKSDLDCHYNIDLVKTDLVNSLGRVNVLSSTLFTIQYQFVLTENEAQIAINKSILDMRREQERKAREAVIKQEQIKRRIDAAFQYVVDRKKSGKGTDFSHVYTLPEECLNSDYFRCTVDKMTTTYYETILEAYFGDGIGISTMYGFLNEISVLHGGINAFAPLKHYDYFVNHQNGLNSILSINTAGDIENIKNMAVSIGTISNPNDLKLTYNKAGKLYKEKYYEEAINLITLVDYDDNELDTIKKWLIFTACNEQEKDFASYYQTLSYINHIVFGDTIRIDDKKMDITNVDAIIAESIRLSSVNSIDKINETLQDFLEIGCRYFRIDREQYIILQNAFAYLNAYKQEEMVLDAMVENHIERTPEQEERLNFFKTQSRGSMSVNNNVTIPVSSFVQNDTSLEQVVYDYGALGWNENDTDNYFNSLSMTNQTTSMAFVVNEWSKNINAYGVKWNIKDVCSKISSVLQNNFDDRFDVKVTESGAYSGWVEYDNTILVFDRMKSGYPWLAFNIIGEQMMKNQITLSLYVMYMPVMDRSLSESKIERNRIMCTKVKMLKQKQNPKINNYIANVMDLIIKELEKCLNSQSEDSIYE